MLGKRTWTFIQKHYEGSKGFDEKRKIRVTLRKGSLMVLEKSDWKRQMLIPNSHLNDTAKDWWEVQKASPCW